MACLWQGNIPTTTGCTYLTFYFDDYSDGTPVLQVTWLWLGWKFSELASQGKGFLDSRSTRFSREFFELNANREGSRWKFPGCKVAGLRGPKPDQWCCLEVRPQPRSQGSRGKAGDRQALAGQSSAKASTGREVWQGVHTDRALPGKKRITFTNSMAPLLQTAYCFQNRTS